MKNRRIYCEVLIREQGQLNYLIVGYSGISPIEFLRKTIEEYRFGLILLGYDAPSFLSNKETERVFEAIHSKGIDATKNAGFIYVRYNELKLYKKDLFTLFGDAVLLTRRLPEEHFNFTFLPKPSGFNKNKISKKGVELLNDILFDDDVYFYDDFVESFIVTKNPEVLDVISEDIAELSKS